MKKLVLVGGGHAHLHVIKKLKENPIKDVEVILISPSKFQFYSGMFSGYAEGLYGKDQICVDLKELAKASTVTWIQGSVLSIDPKAKTVLTNDGNVVFFDVISFDIGSLTATASSSDKTDNIFQVKPNYLYVDVIEQVRKAKDLVIVGGGASGIEVSLSLQAWRNANGINSPLTLVSENRLLKQRRKSVSDKIERIVKDKGVHLIKNECVTRVEKNSVTTSLNNEITFDKLIWLTGPKAHGLFKSSGLPVDKNGFLLVEDTLQVKKYPFIFGAGDCITFRNYPNIDKAGVYAVKEGPILFENIKGYFKSGYGSAFKPQKDYLSILSIGNREGFLLYKGYAFSGKWAWSLKNWIDTKFVKQYQL